MNPESGQSKRRYPLNILILITLLAILLAVWYVTDYMGDRQTGDVQWYPSADCELPEETCQAQLQAERKILFDLNTDEPKPLELLPIRVQLEGFSEAELEALQLELDLQGRDMYMGYNRTPFEHQGEGVFTASPLLGICTDEVMVWRASVMIHPPRGKSYGSYFDFTVTQRNFR